MSATHFVPGLELSRAFYVDAVAPLLARHYPNLIHSAGRLDTGSDVLGFDTERSMDHWWGPRVGLYLREQDYSDELRDEIEHMLGMQLPHSVRGFSTHMHVEDVTTGSVFMRSTDERPINHMCSIGTVAQLTRWYLGINVLDHPLSPGEWLALPEQHLRTIRSGGVWHDGTGELARLRTLLHWYPDHIWRYLLRAQWRRIEQEEAFPGRCAEVGDELGSRVITARMVREVMHLAFLIEREYMPYSKWLGTAFSRLRIAPRLEPALLDALAATDWPSRERALSAAYEIAAAEFNALGLCEPVSATVSPFWGRPFQVIHGDRFAAALGNAAVKPEYFGNTTQWIDSTDALYPRYVRQFAAFYS
ncbi:MAG: DUF4037 domain-containing protein [Chloroflexi bacterium]|nr:DUF4037 domain-containing protein [Chloroflexota bacterium]